MSDKQNPLDEQCEVKTNTGMRDEEGITDETEVLIAEPDALAFAEKNAAGWTSGLGAPTIDYSFDLYDGEDNPATQYPGYVGQIHSDYESPYSGGDTGSYNYYVVKRLRVMMPDGSSHEFRTDDAILLCGNPSTGCAVDQSGTYLSVDGSKLRLTINSDRSAVLYMPDGSFYGFDPYTKFPRKDIRQTDIQTVTAIL